MITNFNVFYQFKHSLNEGKKSDKQYKKAIKENAGENLARKAYDIWEQFNTLMVLTDSGFVNNDLTINSQYSIEDINDHLMHEFSENGDYFETMETLIVFLESCKRVIKCTIGINESIHFEDSSTFNFERFKNIIEEELYWNQGKVSQLEPESFIVYTTTPNRYSSGVVYHGMAGSSISTEIKEAIAKYDANLRYRIMRGDRSRTSDFHDYAILFYK